VRRPMAPSLRIGSIVVDCVDFGRMLEFWQAALRYTPLYPPNGGWVILGDPQGVGPNLSLNRVPRRPPGRNHLHLDLYAKDRQKEVRRLLLLGAKRHRQAYGRDDDFRVLEDPDGNLFCVVQT